MKDFARKYYVLLLSATFFSCNVKQQKTEKQDTDTTIVIEDYISHLVGKYPEYHNWGVRYGLPVPDSFSTMETGQMEITSTGLYISDTFYNLYGKLLVYNDDSSKFIDAYSYLAIVEEDKQGNLSARLGEIDQEVKVYDSKNSELKRVFFSGPTCRVEKVFWYNKDVIGMLGIASEKADGHYSPVIWFMNITNGRLVQYDYNRDINNPDIDNLLKEEIESKGIKWNGNTTPPVEQTPF